LTPTVQDCPGCTFAVGRQLPPVTLNTPATGPAVLATFAPVTLRAAPPVLLTVIVAFLTFVPPVFINGLGAEMPTTACTAVPVMLNKASALLALLMIASVPKRLLLPVLALPIVGVKITFTVQVSAGCKVIPAQPSVPLLKLVPVTASLLM